MPDGIEDEKLMAYVDGELSPAEQVEIESLLARDPELRARAEIFREAAELARRALADTIREPLPAAMLDGIDTADHAGPLARLFRRAGKYRRRWIVPVRGLELTFAAGLLLVVGGVVGSQFGGDPIYGDAIDPRVAAVLSTASSGTVVYLDGPDSGQDVLPLLTFVDGTGRYCRHYLYQGAGSDGGQTLDGVACIDGDGNWQQIVTVRIDPGETDGDGYVTAGGAENALIDGFIDSLMEGAPIVGAEENALIESGWAEDADR